MAISDTNKNHPSILQWELPLSFGLTWFITWLNFYWIPLAEESIVNPYMMMAKHPYSYVVFPYGSRILTPWLVHILPLGIDAGFRMIAFIGLWITGFLLFLIMRQFCTNVILCIGLTALFYLAPTVQFLTENAWFIDPLSYMFLCIALVGATHNQHGIGMAGLTAGALNRPSSILYAPAIILFQRQYPLCKSQVIHSLLVVMPACICITLIFLVWPQVSNYGIINSGNTFGSSDVQTILEQQGLLFLFSTLIYQELLPCLWGVMLIGLLYVNRIVLSACIYIIIISILPMIAATDYFRLPFYAFPALFILSASGFERLYQAKANVSYFWLTLCCIAMYCYPKSILLGLSISFFIITNYYFLKKTTSDKTT